MLADCCVYYVVSLLLLFLLFLLPSSKGISPGIIFYSDHVATSCLGSIATRGHCILEVLSKLAYNYAKINHAFRLSKEPGYSRNILS